MQAPQRLALSVVVALDALSCATNVARAQALGEAPSTSSYSLGAETPSLESLGKRRLAAPSRAFEVSVGTGYVQGFGNLESGVGLPSVATPGVGVDLGLGYRIDPRWAVLWSGGTNELTSERAEAARGVTTSLALQYHVAPLQRLDPWVELGGGLRFLWEDVNVGPTQLTYGFQLARVRAGLDLRASEEAAIGPVLGADATLFLFHDFPGEETLIGDPRLSAFVFAGLQGRFDVGGSTRSTSPALSIR